MTVQYTYRCPVHGEFDSISQGDFAECGYFTGNKICRTESRRVWSWHNDKSFEPYFAPSFGTVVTSRQHAKDLAKIASEEQTLRTGVEHNYEVIDTHDDEAAGVDTAHKEAVAEETRRTVVNDAAWNARRLAKIDEEKQRKRAEREAIAQAAKDSEAIVQEMRG